MEITITDQILTGNMGDGWTDNDDVACAYAAFQEKIWANDLKEIIEEGHTVEFISDIQTVSGYSRGVTVDVDSHGENPGGEFELTERVERLLTGGTYVWDRFLDSDEAEALFADD